MNKETLVKNVTHILGVSSSESELGFELFINGIIDVLDYNEALRIPDLGIFQLKREVLTQNENGKTLDKQTVIKDTLIHAPDSRDYFKETGALYISFDVTARKKNVMEFDESVFSIGVAKPLIPLAEVDNLTSDSGTTYMLLKKSIEERVNEVISTSERLPNFDLWEGYIASSQQSETKEEKIEPTDLDNITEDDGMKELIQSDIKDESASEVESRPFENEEIDESEIEDEDSIVEKLIQEENEAEDEEVEVQIEKKIEELSSITNDELPEIDETDKEATLITEETLLEDVKEATSDSELEDAEDSKSELNFEDKIWIDASDEKELELDWSDELKEELLEVDEFEDKEKVEFQEEKPAGLDDSVETAALDLDIVLEDETESLVATEEESITTVESTDSEEEYEEEKLEVIDEIEEESIEVEPVNEDVEIDVNKTDEVAEKKGFGKLFWILLFIFIIVTSGGVYYFLFHKEQSDQSLQALVDDSSKTQTVPIEQPLIKEDSLLVEESIATTPNIISPAETEIYSWEYNASDKEPLNRVFINETKIRDNIYYDGSKYYVQLSSWRSRTIATSEARRIRGLGFKAFISEVNLPQLGGKWHRIRVGFFNTQDEAQVFLIEYKNL